MSAIAAALIGAGVAGLSNVVNGQNADEGNRWNWATAQMNNNYNMAMLNKQILYNRDMWNAQNKYNSPLNQRKRYEEAGINPYMALGNIQSGNAQSAGGVNPPSASPVAPANVPHFDGSGIQSSIQNYMSNSIQQELISAQSNLMNEQAQQIHIENGYKASMLAQELQEMKERTSSYQLKNYYQQTQNRYAADMFSTDIRYRQNQIDDIQAGIRLKSLQIAMNEINLNNLPQQYKLSFASAAADTALAYAQEKLTKQQAFHELQKKFKTMQETYGLKLNNGILKKTAQDIIDKTHKENAGYYWQMGADALGSLVNGVVGFGLGRIGKAMDLAGGRKIITYQRYDDR